MKLLEKMLQDLNIEQNLINQIIIRYSTSNLIKAFIEELKKLKENDNPINHIKKFEIVKGDAIETVSKYLNDNNQTIISLVYFDFDVYEPTKRCLKQIKDRLIKGSIVAFDELNDKDSPGETIALMDAIGLNNIRLKKYRYANRISYFVKE